MTDVFISYSADDEEKASEVQNLLSSYGVKAFLAGISLEPGCDWGEEILDNLHQSKWVLFLASASACESAAVQQELGVALGTEKEIIPVTWDIKPEQLPGWIKGKQAIDLVEGSVEVLEPVIQKISKKVKSSAFIGGLIVSALLIGIVCVAAKSK